MVLSGSAPGFPKINDLSSPDAMKRSGLVSLLILFGTLYFVQGIVEPTACLPLQPLQAQLHSWNFSVKQAGRFLGIIGIAWSLKPLFGLASDFVPIAGYRRWPYLILSTARAAAAFLAIAALWQDQPPAEEGAIARGFSWLMGRHAGQPAVGRLGWLLVVASVGIAMTDVVVDGLAVETGQPLGITGRIQSVQWGALSIAQLLVGALGGYVAQHHLQRPMFIACGCLALGSLAVVLVGVTEPRQAARPRDNARLAWRQLVAGRKLPQLLTAAAFLFLWNFNPFSSTVLQDYATHELRFTQQFYGQLTSVQAAGMIAGCLGYWQYCRRVPLGWLVHGAIIAGIVGTLAYWTFASPATAVVASFVFGFAWQTATLVQLDLAARICPTETAGTLFALLMAISNTGMNLGIYLGGGWYEALVGQFQGNHRLAFQSLVAIGAAFTAGCWLLVPLMKWSGLKWD
jgi:hypothetical protein